MRSAELKRCNSFRLPAADETTQFLEQRFSVSFDRVPT